MPSTISPEAASLIKKMLRMNPHERPSAEEVLIFVNFVIDLDIK
jgi:hypothetical protein